MTPSVLADLGYSYELDGDKQQAADAYAQAANADPKNIGYQLSAAQSQLRVGDLEKTKSYLSRAAAINPNHYRLHAIRALLAKTENNQDDAIAEYNAAISGAAGGRRSRRRLVSHTTAAEPGRPLSREPATNRRRTRQIADGGRADQQAGRGGPGEGGIPAGSRRVEDVRQRLEGRRGRPAGSAQARSGEHQHHAAIREPVCGRRGAGTRRAKSTNRC